VCSAGSIDSVLSSAIRSSAESRTAVVNNAQTSCLDQAIGSTTAETAAALATVFPLSRARDLPVASPDVILVAGRQRHARREQTRLGSLTLCFTGTDTATGRAPPEALAFIAGVPPRLTSLLVDCAGFGHINASLTRVFCYPEGLFNAGPACSPWPPARLAARHWRAP
jgi:hypothetical protein